MRKSVLTHLFVCAVIVLFATTAWTAMLVGTTGSGGTLSTLVEIDPATGVTVRTIGAVGYVVNGLEYDATTGKLYGSTSVKDPNYTGLIEIDINTGAGTPIGDNGWGLSGITVITNITVDSTGQMFGWWEGNDDLVGIDKTTGIATRVGESGIIFTAKNGLDFDSSDTLYMVNIDGSIYTVNTITGAATLTGSIGTIAHHGDFDPSANLYYGISSTWVPRSLVIADLSTGTVISNLSDLDDDIHTLTFIIDKMEVPLDIKPGSCPNPINVNSKGKLPVAILGTEDLDVTQIDPTSIRLMGVAPLRSDLEDVGTPFEPFIGKEDCHFDCTEDGSDEFTDLTLEFDTQEVVAALGEVSDGDCVVLSLTGNLLEEFGGTPIDGEDVVIILDVTVKKVKDECPCWTAEEIEAIGRTFSPHSISAFMWDLPSYDKYTLEESRIGSPGAYQSASVSVWPDTYECVYIYYDAAPGGPYIVRYQEITLGEYEIGKSQILDQYQNLLDDGQPVECSGNLCP